MANLATRTSLRAARQPAPFLVPQPAAAPPVVDWRVFTVDQLVVSPFNVRTNQHDIDATDALEASILARGILEPIVVHPLRDRPGVFGVFAGGRRLRAVQRLIARGVATADFTVPAIVRDLSDAELISDSLAENLLRRDLRDYERFFAIRQMVEAGHDVATVAREYGQELTVVRRWLRLGQLAPPVFAAFAAEAISLEAARAYAATEDVELQTAVFERLMPLPEWERRPANIRAALGIADRHLDRLLRFVGDAAYRDAGGRFELDLFADAAETRGRVVDPPVLQTLAATRLAALKEELREAARRPLKFETQPPRSDYDTDYSLQILPEGDDPAKLPTGDVIATVEILESGQAQVRFWWASRKAKTGKAEKPRLLDRRAEGAALRTGGGYDATAAQQANAAIREDAGLSATGVEVLRSLRQTALRAMLVEAARGALKADVANDWLVWSQLRMLLGNDDATQTGLARIAHGQARVLPDVVRAHVEPTPGHEFWDAARADLWREAFMLEKSPPASFALFRAAPRQVKELAAAILVGSVVERALDADGYRIALHDAVALELAHDSHETADRAVAHWVPPGDALLNMLPTKELRELADPWIERVTAGKWQQLKRPALVCEVARLLDGSSPHFKNASAKIAARQWFHPLLAFGAENRPLAHVVSVTEKPAAA